MLNIICYGVLWLVGAAAFACYLGTRLHYAKRWDEIERQWIEMKERDQ